jgi:putative glutamine amidotransferase
MRAGLTFRCPKRAEAYAAALRSVRVEPVLISPETPRSLAGLDGLLVSGGSDVDPARYGQARDPESSEPDQERDELEAALIGEALEAGLPLLAICRGLQLLNVFRGGSLRQHVESHRQKGVVDAHSVTIVAGTRLASILGTGTIPVNSRHHQTVDRLGEGLVVSATAPDGVVEALEDPLQRFAIAVQWHPEERIDAGAHDRMLFEAFAAAL